MDVNDVTSRLNEQMTTELYKQLGTVSKKTITSTLLDNLIEMIMNENPSGPTTPFQTKTTMCAQLGVSRSSLREAYTALAAMGFIRRTKSGTTVNPMRQIVASIPLPLPASSCGPGRNHGIPHHAGKRRPPISPPNTPTR